MLLSDSVVIYVRRCVGEAAYDGDAYGAVFDRYILHSVMVFEKIAVGSDNRDDGKYSVYIFPERSRVYDSGGKPVDIPEIRPGDLCSAVWNDSAGEGSVLPLIKDCRRIISVEPRKNGSGRTHHIVVEAV